MNFDLGWVVLATAARKAADALATQWFGAAGPAAVTAIVQLAKPVDPFDQPSFFAPLIGLAAAVAGLLLTGVAVSSLSALLASLVGLGFLLARVYGITINFAQFRAA